MAAVELTSDEDALISLVRGEPDASFSITISNYGSFWTTSLITDDGVVCGRGDTFRQAFIALFDLREKPKAVEPALKLVAGTQMAEGGS